MMHDNPQKGVIFFMNSAKAILACAEQALGVSAKDAEVHALHGAVGDAVLREILPHWNACRQAHLANRRVCYFSMEFLMGRAVYNNLYCLGLLPDIGTLPAGAGNRNHKGMPKSACFLLLVSSLPLVVRDLFSSMRLRHPAALSRFHPALPLLHCPPCSVCCRSRLRDCCFC